MWRVPLFVASFLLIPALLLCSCGDGTKDGKGSASQPPTAQPSDKRIVVVYTPHGDMGKDAKVAFEAKYPDIAVHLLDLGGGQILPKIRAEKARPACDIWWGGSPGDFKKAEAEGLLEPCAPAWAKHLPGGCKSPSGAWHADFISPEVIMYNEEKLNATEVPDTWEGLLDPKWKGRIVLRDVRASATMKTIFGALIWREWKRTGDVEEGFRFLEKLQVNTGNAYAANPEDMFAKLAAPKTPYALTLWNMFDALGRKHNHKLPFGFKIPRDTPLPCEPVAFVKGGPHPEEANLFFDFVTAEETLLRHAEKFFRIPARTDLAKEKLPTWMRDFKLEPLKLDWDELDKHLEAWILRWQTQIRSQEQ